MTKAEMVAMLRAGKVQEFNSWRRQNPDAVIELNGADLSWAKLMGANFSFANGLSAEVQAQIIAALMQSWR